MAGEQQKPAAPAAPKAASQQVSPELLAKIEAELREKIRKEEEQKVKDRMSGNGPKYRVEMDCYLTGDVHALKGQEIVYDGQPGPYLTPLNDKAREAMKKAGLLDDKGNVKHVELVKV